MFSKDNPFIAEGALVGRGTTLTHLSEEFEKSVPYVDFEYVTVTFPTANTDYDIIHHLKPPTPEDVDYHLVRANAVCGLYNDTSGTRRVWGNGYITLRSSTALVTVTILLTVRRT